MTDPTTSSEPPPSGEATSAEGAVPDSTLWSGRPRWQIRLAAVVAGAVAAFLVWLVADPLAGATLEATQPGGDVAEITGGQVVGAAVIQSLVGWGLLALMERFLDRAKTIWLVVVVVLLVLAGINALVAAENTAAGIWLNVMHLAVAAVVVPVLAATSPRS